VSSDRRTVVIGVGNEFRRDDGLGPAVLARLRDLQPADANLAGVTLAVSDGEPSRMIELWADADLAVVVDAIRDTGVPTGHRYELDVDALTGTVHAAASSHGIDLGDTVELARALGRMPARLVVLAVAGHEFGFGIGLSSEVAVAVGPLVERVCETVSTTTPGPDTT
jgi:hydrogenase maturation protease